MDLAHPCAAKPVFSASLVLQAPPSDTLAGEIFGEGVVNYWISYLGASDSGALARVCRSLCAALRNNQLWEEAARTLRYTRGLVHKQNPAAPWRKICAFHERLWHAWRGSPKSFKLNLRDELRSQNIADLDVLIVEFLVGEDAFVLGHSHGAISIWELRPTGEWKSTKCAEPERSQATGTKAGPELMPPLEARVLGVFQTCRSYDVQHVDVWPNPVTQPTALALGSRILLAAAVGPTAYIWESARRCNSSDCVSAHAANCISPNVSFVGGCLSEWSNVGALRHKRFFMGPHHAVWSVKLGNRDDQGCYRAVTVSEDGILRAWSFGSDFTGQGGYEGWLLWQCDVGDARQAVATILPSPSMVAAISHKNSTSHIPSKDASVNECRSIEQSRINISDNVEACHALIVVIARADSHSLQLLDLQSGGDVETIHGVWPIVRNSLPQAVAYDRTLNGASPMALFSSITEAGDGVLARVDLTMSTSPLPDREGGETPSSIALNYVGSFDVQSCPSVTSHRVSPIVGPVVGPGRVLRQALAVPSAGVFVALVHGGDPTDLLEVWDRQAVFGDVTSCEDCERLGTRCTDGSSFKTTAHFRARIPAFLGNSRFVAMGGRRLILLYPAALLSLGELRVLEWHTQSRASQHRAPKRSQRFSWFTPAATMDTPASCCGLAALIHATDGIAPWPSLQRLLASAAAWCTPSRATR